MKYWVIALMLSCSLCFAQSGQHVYYDNVVVVVDASGSMAFKMTGTDTTKMDLAKEALSTVLSQVDSNTQIGIVVFGRVNNDWVYPLSLRDDEKLTKAIFSIDTGGGTPLGTYIKKGADALIKQRHAQFGYGTYRLVILTDGEASGGSEQRMMKTYTAEIKRRGIDVDVIGVDMQQDHALKKIVGHRYHSANDPASLLTAAKIVFAEVSKDNPDAVKDFELLEGLDPALASKMLSALSNPQNHPIGTTAPRPKSPPMSSSQGVQDFEPDDSGGGSSGMWTGGIIFVVICGVVLLARKN